VTELGCDHPPGPPREGTTRLTVAVIVPVRNERPRLPGLLTGIERQTRRPDEVIFSDGASDDGSRAWLEQASLSRPWLKLVDNPDEVIPAALNRAAATANSDVIARMDAHADYDPEYLAELVGTLEDRPDLVGVGGAMATSGAGPWGRAIAAVLASRWGLGGTPHRVGGEPGPVEHTFCTAYRRAVVLASGGWDRRLLANEDVELDHRVRRHGDIWLVPSARTTWYTRDDPRALARQMWRYGYFRARTAHLHPSTFKARHLAPLAVLVSPLVATTVGRRLGAAVAGAYLAGGAAVAVRAARRSGASPARAAIALPIIHLSWGAGYGAGLARHAGAVSEPGLACGRSATTGTR
jgi:succinoglycan biosynthesis protein ExoA